MHRPPHNLKRRLWLLAALVIAVAVAAVLALTQAPGTVQAKSNYQDAFVTAYPTAEGSKLTACRLCHSSAPELNAFGAEYEEHGHSFQAIELLDSDGDGWSNLTEITAKTWPGDAADRPAGTAPPAEPITVPQGEGPDQTAEYRLIGWNDLGMHCLDDTFDVFSILPPYNNLWAQLVRVPDGGSPPEVITDNVTVEYGFIDNTSSAGKINFWDYVDALFGVSLAPDVGLTGMAMSGQMHATGDHFVAEGVPLTPYTDSEPDLRQPYQLAHLVARNTTTGDILAETTFVAPVSDEINCLNCHSDGQQEDIATGNWRLNILTLHDLEENTNLVDSQPVLCAGCHASAALGTSGQPGVPNLSRAMHGKHAPESGDIAVADQVPPDTSTALAWVLGQDDQRQAWSSPRADLSQPADEGTNDCYQCHPGPETLCLRDTMSSQGMWCTDCHGDMNAVASPDRQPWLDEPQCGTCHGPAYAENPGKLFRQSVGHGGLYCEACHNSTHAILPSSQPLDNQQVIALQGYAGTLQDCAVCHGTDIPDGPGPHGLTAPSRRLYLPMILR